MAARLTGLRIEIKSEAQAAAEASGFGPDADPVEYAEGAWVQNRETGEMEWHAADGTVIGADEWERQAHRASQEAQAVRDNPAAEVAPAAEAETPVDVPALVEGESSGEAT